MFHGYTGQSSSSTTGYYPSNSSTSTPQFSAGPSSFASSPQSTYSQPQGISPHPTAVTHPDLDSSSGRLTCMWGSCNASFSTLSELVGHVNLQHLRLPAQGQPLDTTQLSTTSLATNDSNPLACLWADCHLYPTPDSIPGPSSGIAPENTLGVLANHLGSSTMT